MYKYEWDIETGGYLLTLERTQIIAREIRPVFSEELDALGLDKHWQYPKDSNQPLLWCEMSTFFYKGRKVAVISGGGFYTTPSITVLESNLVIDPVNVNLMIHKNKSIIDTLVSEAIKAIYSIVLQYEKKGFKIYVGFSGGKDSFAVLDLVYRSLPTNAYKVIFGDTDMELPDTYDIIKNFEKYFQNVEFHTARSHFSALKSWQIFGPPSRTKRWCCTIHKTTPSILKLKELYPNENVKALAILGMRAEESLDRSEYTTISTAKKHSIQTNFLPILNWNAAELYLYLLQRNLLCNNAYKKGLSRVGCIVCPMASSRYDFFVRKNYKDRVDKFLNIIRQTSNKDFVDESDVANFLENGGWRARASGIVLKDIKKRLIQTNEGKIIHFSCEGLKEKELFEWLKTLGEIAKTGTTQYELLSKNTKLGIIKFSINSKNELSMI